MQANPIDPSLAYTALKETDPEFGKRTVLEGGQIRQRLLAAYYAQEEIRNLWDFTRHWVKQQQASASEGGRQ